MLMGGEIFQNDVKTGDRSVNNIYGYGGCKRLRKAKRRHFRTEIIADE